MPRAAPRLRALEPEARIPEQVPDAVGEVIEERDAATGQHDRAATPLPAHCWKRRYAPRRARPTTSQQVSSSKARRERHARDPVQDRQRHRVGEAVDRTGAAKAVCASWSLKLPGSEIDAAAVFFPVAEARGLRPLGAAGFGRQDLGCPGATGAASPGRIGRRFLDGLHGQELCQNRVRPAAACHHARSCRHPPRTS